MEIYNGISPEQAKGALVARPEERHRWTQCEVRALQSMIKAGRCIEAMAQELRITERHVGQMVKDLGGVVK